MNFNEKCYKLLSTVPSGKVTTYKFLAEALGTKAYRAVGNAMNQNPYPRDIVPCHRVIGSDGELRSYLGGIAVKKWLLEHEQGIRSHALIDQL